jgi:hypothetical protein
MERGGFGLGRERFEGDTPGFSGLAARLHDYLDIMLERGEHFHQAFH